MRLVTGLIGNRKTDLRFCTGVPERLFDDPLSLVRLEILFMLVSAAVTGVKNRLGFACTGDVTLLCAGDVFRDSVLAGGLSVITFVALSFERIRPSNSTSRYDGLCGTWPTTYGLPLRVAAGFHCLRDDVPNSEGSRRRVDPFESNCCLYSRGTNSSNSISVVDVRGSEVPEVMLARATGSDLNSTYKKGQHE